MTCCGYPAIAKRGRRAISLAQVAERLRARVAMAASAKSRWWVWGTAVPRSIPMMPMDGRRRRTILLSSGAFDFGGIHGISMGSDSIDFRNQWSLTPLIFLTENEVKHQALSPAQWAGNRLVVPHRSIRAHLQRRTISAGKEVSRRVPSSWQHARARSDRHITNLGAGQVHHDEHRVIARPAKIRGDCRVARRERHERSGSERRIRPAQVDEPAVQIEERTGIPILRVDRRRERVRLRALPRGATREPEAPPWTPLHRRP